MLETTLLALEDLMLDKIVDEAGRKVLLSEFSKIMQQVRLLASYLIIYILELSKNEKQTRFNR